MAWRGPGDKPLSEPMMVTLLRHICITRPQWVNKYFELACIKQITIYDCITVCTQPGIHPNYKAILKMTPGGSKYSTVRSVVNLSTHNEHHHTSLSYIHGLVQDCSISTALAKETPQYWTESSIFPHGYCLIKQSISLFCQISRNMANFLHFTYLQGMMLGLLFSHANLVSTGSTAGCLYDNQPYYQCWQLALWILSAFCNRPVTTGSCHELTMTFHHTPIPWRHCNYVWVIVMCHLRVGSVTHQLSHVTKIPQPNDFWNCPWEGTPNDFPVWEDTFLS